MLNRKKLLLSTLIIPIFLAGCWGKIEIENRGFVVGTAIDIAEEREDHNNILLMTNQLINTSATDTAASGGGADGQNAFINIQATDQSLFAASRKMRKLTNLIPYYQHLKVILVSQDVLEEPGLFADMMDVFVRNHELRRGVKVFVTEGEANKILDFVPKIEKTPAMFLEKLTQNSKNAGTLEPKKLDRLQNIFIYERSYFIPRVKLVNNEIIYEDAVVVAGENNQMVGVLNAEDTKGLMYIDNQTSGGSIETVFDGNKVTIETAKSKAKMTLTNKDKDNLVFSLKIKYQGSIEEHFGDVNLLKSKTLRDIETALERDIKKMVEQTIEKTQKEYGVDVISLGNVVRNNHYKLWKTIVDNWDRGENYFSKSTINVTVEANIESTGAANRIQEKGKRDE